MYEMVFIELTLECLVVGPECAYVTENYTLLLKRVWACLSNLDLSYTVLICRAFKVSVIRVKGKRFGLGVDLWPPPVRLRLCFHLVLHLRLACVCM